MHICITILLTAYGLFFNPFCSFFLLLSYFLVWWLSFSLVQSLSSVRFFATPWIVAHQASLSITSSRSLPKLMSIESMMPSNHLILCHPLLLLPSIFPSMRVFSNESAIHIRWPKYWSLSFNISPSKEHSGLISFRMDLLDLLAVQGTLKSLLQYHSSKASWLSLVECLYSSIFVFCVYIIGFCFVIIMRVIRNMYWKILSQNSFHCYLCPSFFLLWEP